MMRHLRSDLRYAGRQLRRSPTFTIVAALTLGLGIGATTAVFSVVDAVLLRALPYPEPSRLVVLYGERAATEAFPATTDNPASYLNFLDWQAQNTAFDHLMLFRRRRFNAGARAGPERVQGALVSADVFRDNEWIEVVGVTGDVHHQGLEQAAEPQIMVPLAQSGDPAVSLVVRTGADPLALARPIQEIVSRLDPDIPLAETRTMEDAVGSSITSQRMRTALVGGLASIALFLAAIGIYGVMAYLVAQSGRDIALRIALGAKGSDVLAGVVRQSLRLALPGIGIGLAATLAFSKVLRGFLYEVAPTDPLNLVAVAGATLILVVLATLIPARRAARLDPMALLRSD
jgi:hypothetical protein